MNIPINSINQEYVDYSDEVFTALSEGKPVVTLETAIVTHGMPHPTNVETALKVQNIVREKVCIEVHWFITILIVPYLLLKNLLWRNREQFLLQLLL